MAKKEAAAAGGKARVLLNCHLGNVNDVVTLGDKDIQAALDSGLVDNDADAVAFAESLKQEKPAPVAEKT